MSTLKVNHFGEIEVTENDLVYFSPVTEFNNSNVTTDKLKKDYSNFIDKLNYTDFLAPINEFAENGKFVEFHYHQENTAFYHTIRNLDFDKQLNYFRSIIEIAKIQEKKMFKFYGKLIILLFRMRKKMKKLEHYYMNLATILRFMIIQTL